MANAINLVQNTSESYEIDLVDGDGEPVTMASLEGAVAVFSLRETATGPDVLTFTTPDTAHLTFKDLTPTLVLSFLPSDTLALDVGTYTYRIRVTMEDGTVLDAIEWSPFDLNLGGSAATPPPTFSNTVSLDHNYELTDNLRYVTPGGAPISNAQIRVFFRSEYNAGVFTSPVGVSLTNTAGRWTMPVMVTPGFEYVVQFFKPNEYGPNIVVITA